ncbi:MAG: hypothetical protein J6Q73_03925 [Bacteroidaceae bacterium]|nr:hypothetical protein [Bacteroidaceae bacterium]
MKKLLFLVLLSVTISTVKAQDKTIIITESNRPYTSQTWFYSGKDKALQEDKIKKNWNQKERRITSAAYTKNGWFVTMAKNTGIDKQTYKYSITWPEEWIKDKWSEGYKITSISKGKDKWLVVMSKGHDYKMQCYRQDELSNIKNWIKHNWDKGYYITNAAYDGSLWTVVMSQTNEFVSQGYFLADNYDKMAAEIREDVWGNDLCIHLIESDGDDFLVVYGRHNNCDHSQNYSVNNSDVSKYIDKRWDNSYHITYIGGGSSSQNTKSVPCGGSSGMRTGNIYYRNDSYQVGDFKFYYQNGKYMAETSLTGMAHKYAIRYILSEETNDVYIFRQCIQHNNGKIEIPILAPQMTISKDWSRILIENTIFGNRIVLTEEITKSEYDKITQTKDIYPQ